MAARSALPGIAMSTESARSYAILSIGAALLNISLKYGAYLMTGSVGLLIVAANIVRTGFGLLGETGSGLMDSALPVAEQQIIVNTFASYEQKGIQFHALRSRVAGTRRFVSFHVLVPGTWTVQQGHNLCEEIELAIIKALPGAHVITHLEPLEDLVSWADRGLDRIGDLK